MNTPAQNMPAESTHSDVTPSRTADATAADASKAIDPAKLAPTTLILGCGFLGKPLAQQLIKLGLDVHGSTRSQDHAVDLAAMGIRPAILSVTQRLTLAAISHLLDGRPLDVIYLIPPGKPDQHTSPHDIVINGITNVLATLAKANVRRAILVSSTAVYGSPAPDAIADDQAGNHTDQPRTFNATSEANTSAAVRVMNVTPDTPAFADNPRARLLLQGEELWQQAGEQYHVLRLCGLYGPRRIVGMAAILQGAPIAGNPQALLNLIHVDDAVSLLIHMLAADQIAPVELGSDTNPIPRLTYYNYLASLLKQPAPQVMDNADAAIVLGQRQGSRLQRAANKSCDPAQTCQRTGWRPGHTDFRLGLQDALTRSKSKP